MRPSRRSTKRDGALVAGGALAASVLLFPGALLRGEIFFERDLGFDWYLRLAAVARAVAEGAPPLWDAGVSFGQPLLADPGTQVLYPTTWLGLVLPRAAGYTVFVVVHLLVAALGAWRLARAWGAGRLGSAVAGLALMLAGPLQSLVNVRQHLAGAAWIPWCLLAAEGAAIRPGRPAALRLAAVLGAQVLAGSPDMCAMGWLLALAWIVARTLARRRARPAAAAIAGTAAAATVAAVLATAVVWLPALDALSRSPRRDLGRDVREAWSVPPAGLLRVAVPLDPARVVGDPEVRRRLFDRSDLPFLFSLYLGTPLLALAVAGLAAGQRRRRWGTCGFLAGTAAVALALSLGPHAPFYPAAAQLLPALRILRYPSKVMVVLSLALALLAGLGCSAVRLGRVRRAGLIALAVALALSAPLVWRASQRYGRPAAPATAAAAGAAVLVAAHAIGLLRARLAVPAVATACAFDLIAVHAGLNATAPEPLFFTPPAALTFVPRGPAQRLYVYDYHSLPDAAPSRLGRTDPYPTTAPPTGIDRRAFTVAALQSYLLPPWGALFSVPTAFEFDMRGLYSRDLNDLTFFVRRLEGRPEHERLLAMSGVGTVLSLHGSGLERLVPVARVPSVFPEPIRVARVPGGPRRARLVGCARAADLPAAFALLASPGFDPSAEAIVTSPPAGLLRCGPAGESRIVSVSADRVRVETDAARPSLLVLADTWDPGWRASVDGRAAEVLQANVAFRAVAVPAGRHDVEMVYRPRSASVGLVVSLATLAGAAVAAVALRRGSRGSVPRGTRS